MAQNMPPAIVAIVHRQERQLLWRFFKNQGFAAFSAGDADKALLTLREHPDAFLILDAALVQGFTPPEEQTPFLVLAGGEHELPTLEQALALGVRGLLLRPLPAPEGDPCLKRCMALYFRERTAAQDALLAARQLQLLRRSLRQSFIRALAKSRLELLPAGEAFREGNLRLLCYAPESTSSLDAGGWSALEKMFSAAWRDAGDFWPGGVMEGCCYGLLCQPASLVKAGREVVFWLGGMTLLEGC